MAAPGAAASTTGPVMKGHSRHQCPPPPLKLLCTYPPTSGGFARALLRSRPAPRGLGLLAQRHPHQQPRQQWRAVAQLGREARQRAGPRRQWPPGQQQAGRAEENPQQQHDWRQPRASPRPRPRRAHLLGGGGQGQRGLWRRGRWGLPMGQGVCVVLAGSLAWCVRRMQRCHCCPSLGCACMRVCATLPGVAPGALEAQAAATCPRAERRIAPG